MLTGICGMFILSILLSCGKGGAEINEDGTVNGSPHVTVPNDIVAPVIMINSPAANQVFTTGSVINISGTLTDDYGLYRGIIRITNDANGSSVLSQCYEIHGLLAYTFNLNHTASVSIPTDYTVTVSFEDHGLNSTSKTVKIKVNP